MQIILFQPDIPQNVGTIIRMAACFDISLHLIEPFGFVWDDARLRRAGMDYRALAQVIRHPSWERFQADRGPGRLVLFTTKTQQSHIDLAFRSDDWLLFGRESAGVPDFVHAAAEEHVRIPMVPIARSLNVAMSAAIGVGEALRQTGQYPHPLLAE